MEKHPCLYQGFNLHLIKQKTIDVEQFFKNILIKLINQMLSFNWVVKRQGSLFQTCYFHMSIFRYIYDSHFFFK